MSLIETDDLVKRYPGVTALDSLTLQVEPGIIGLVGPNGAGKSTLIKLLLGLIAPSSGRAEVFGLDAARESLRIRELVGYLPEHDCLPGDISASSFVVHMARMSGIPASAARERAAETLRHVGLFEERYRPMSGYSTGMKQRVKLAQALVHDPRLLFLDEPTNGLDPQGRDEMLDLVERTGGEFGVSIIMSSHLLSEIERICERLIVIDEGRIVRAGTIADLTDVTSFLRVEVEFGADRLAARLAERGLPGSADAREVEVEVIPERIDQAQELIVETVESLGLPLIRLEQRRRRLEELFEVAEPAVPAEEAGP
ncbi:MAG: ABC transporter ATP-binding protein [Chloroflexi bacterium]|nr:ABC transporter ATP-binding protein [Chloroflexota bacterium]